MYCQHCGAEMGEGRFCRKCGAASGTAPLIVQPSDGVQTAATPDYEKGLKKLFMGLAFLIIAVFPIFTSGRFWWWMLFPAVPLLAAGIGEFMRARHASTLPAASAAASLSTAEGRMPPATQSELPRARNTSELAPPPSVTEDKTRILDKERAP